MSEKKKKAPKKVASKPRKPPSRATMFKHLGVSRARMVCIIHAMNEYNDPYNGDDRTRTDARERCIGLTRRLLCDMLEIPEQRDNKYVVIPKRGEK